MSVELLAPVGSYESFIGAINEGADAIYLGVKNFLQGRIVRNFQMKNFNI